MVGVLPQLHHKKLPMDVRALWLKCENLQDFLMYLEVCFKNIKSHRAFWKMMQAFCLPKCITLFFSMIPSGYWPNTVKYHGNIKTTCQFLHLVTWSKGESLETNIPKLYLKQPFISKTPTPPMLLYTTWNLINCGSTY